MRQLPEVLCKLIPLSVLEHFLRMAAFLPLFFALLENNITRLYHFRSMPSKNKLCSCYLEVPQRMADAVFSRKQVASNAGWGLRCQGIRTARTMHCTCTNIHWKRLHQHKNVLRKYFIPVDEISCQNTPRLEQPHLLAHSCMTAAPSTDCLKNDSISCDADSGSDRS